MTSVTVDVSGAKKKTRNITKGIRTMMGGNAISAGKMASWQCMYYTLPTTPGNPWNFSKMEERIIGDVKSTYFTKSDDNWQWGAYNIIKEHKGEKRADEWWGDYRSKSQSFNQDQPDKLDYEVQFDKMRFPAGTKSANEQKYLQYRKANNYKVPEPRQNGYKTLGVVSEGSRQNLLKRRQKTKGLAKAGWFAAYHHIPGGGRLKVSTMGGKDRTWPKEIRVPYTLFGGKKLGTSRITANPKGFHGRITNAVRYADEAFPDHLKAKVVPLVERYMKILFDLRKKNIARTGLPKAA